MTLFGYILVKEMDLDKLVINKTKVESEISNLKHMNEVLEQEKITLIKLLDQSEHMVRMLNQ